MDGTCLERACHVACHAAVRPSIMAPFGTTRRKAQANGGKKPKGTNKDPMQTERGDCGTRLRSGRPSLSSCELKAGKPLQGEPEEVAVQRDNATNRVVVKF